MRTLMKRCQLVATSLFLAFITSLITPTCSAQEFTKIVEGYHCARFSNGKQFLVLKSDTGFSLVKNSEVKERFARQKRLYVQRKRIIDETIRNFVKSRISATRLLSSVNQGIKRLFGEIPAEVPASEAETLARNFSARINNEITILNTVRSLISQCESGINPKKGAGNVLGPTIEIVSIAHRTGIEGGVIIHTTPQRVQFSSKPGGYTGCLKLVYPDGTVTSFYAGFGRDTNRCFPGNFDSITQAQCEALIPEGRVGWVLQLSEYNFLSLPEATTEQLLDRMRLELVPRKPAASIFAFTKNTSRDSALKICERF